MKIQTNTAANSALGYMKTNAMATERSIQKLSSGFRINRAADDAAGLAIANQLRADAKTLGQAQKNAQQASSMLQIADGAASTVGNIFDRMRELASQGASANVGGQGGKLQDEWNALYSEVDRIIKGTSYQGTNVLTKLTATAAVAATTGTAAVAAVAAVAATATADAGAAANGIASVAVTDATKITADGQLSFASVGDGQVSVTDGTTTKTYALVASDTELDLTADFGVKITLGAGFTAEDSTATPATTLSFLGDTIDLTAPVAAVAAVAAVPATAAVAAASAPSILVGTSASQGAGAAGYLSDDSIGLDIGSLDVNAINDLMGAGNTVSSAVSLTTAAGSRDALARLDTALQTLNTFVGKLGAAESRIDYATQNVDSMLQNTQAAESSIRDADMAQEMTTFTKNNILQQAAQSMLAQANQGSQGILQLLRG